VREKHCCLAENKWLKAQANRLKDKTAQVKFNASLLHSFLDQQGKANEFLVANGSLDH
jgi:hypothetical protein